MSSPEQQARIEIDNLLTAAGWAVQDFNAADLHATRGVVLREFELNPGQRTADYLLHVDGKTLRRDRGQEAGFHAHGVAIPSAPLHAGPARKPAGVGSPAPRRLPTAVIVDKIAACTNTQVVRFWPVGQDVFREALLDYWGGACAVTGLALPDVLRASHAKPWADCTSDEERVDVFNGFPLAVHLDALFDRGLISFDAGGDMVTAPRLTAEHLASLHLGDGLRLRWVAPEHLPFLQWHREHEFRG